MKYGTLREVGGIGLVLGVRLPGEFRELRAWTGSVARDEYCCSAGAGGGSAGGGLNRALGGEGWGTEQLARAGGGCRIGAPVKG